MWNLLKAFAHAPSPNQSAWTSLVRRSIAVWDEVVEDEDEELKDIVKDSLLSSPSLSDFFNGESGYHMFWFFQKRSAFMSQKRMTKWSCDNLDDYVLLPATSGFVWRKDCFFVSHFWRSQRHPDPDGEYLSKHQAGLESQDWSYIWVDWSCMPQAPRSLLEQKYFDCCLGTISGIIRNCGFAYFYPPFEPRLWILYEISEYVLTSSGGIVLTSDIEPYLLHLAEMQRIGVQETVARHGYTCSFDGDKQFLISWLELLILLHANVNLDYVRKIMDNVTWHRAGHQWYPGVQLSMFEGTLVIDGEIHTFTPFPRWNESKYSPRSTAVFKLSQSILNILVDYARAVIFGCVML